MKYVLWFGMLINGLLNECEAETISIGLEPFPPFINENGEGLSVDMFRAIEKVSDLKFDIKIMTYARAKHELQLKRLDIAGHTPHSLETKDFYQYGQDLNWRIETTSDFFGYDKRLFNPENIQKRKIGTTQGNAGFFAKKLNIDASYFVEVRSLNQLVDMLLKRRIDVILFERVSVMTLLKQRKAEGVYYQSIGHMPASLAVSNDAKGDALKAKLDKAISLIDFDKIYTTFYQYSSLPAQGVVPINF